MCLRYDSLNSFSRADPSHEDGDDDGPEADEEERKAIFSMRNTLGMI